MKKSCNYVLNFACVWLLYLLMCFTRAILSIIATIDNILHNIGFFNLTILQH